MATKTLLTREQMLAKMDHALDEEIAYTILYHGSLNALSHRDMYESMLHIITPHIVQGVREPLVESKPTKLKRNITLTEAEEKSLKAVYVSVGASAR